MAPPAPPVLGAEASLPPPDSPLPEDDDCSPERGLPPRWRQSLEYLPEFPPPELAPLVREAWAGRVPDEDDGRDGAPDGAPFLAAMRAVGGVGA